MASDKFRQGINSSIYDTWGYEGSYAYWIDDEKKPLTKQCSCGTSKTYGDSVGIEAHQTYCDLVRKDDNSKTGS